MPPGLHRRKDIDEQGRAGTCTVWLLCAIRHASMRVRGWQVEPAAALTVQPHRV